MDLLRAMGTDPNKEKSGAWISIQGKDVPEEERAMLCIARIGNEGYTKAMEPMTRKVTEIATRNASSARSKGTPDQIDDAEWNEAQTIALSRHVLLGWKNLTLDNTPVEYSEQKAYDLLSDPRLKSFRNLVLELARDEENFRLDFAEEALGNSSNM